MRATEARQKQKTPIVLNEGDASCIEVAKRPRGRPPGSKNKPKPPTIVTCGSETYAAAILEIPSGHDVIHSIVKFSRRENLGLCVLSATGAVSNVTLCQPPHPTAEGAGAGAATKVGFHGRFEILSLSATVMPASASASASSPGASVSLAGPQGQVLGETLVGPLVAAETVTVVAATFKNPTFHRLTSVEEEVARTVSVSGGGDESSRPHQQQQQQEEEQKAEEENQQQQPVAAESCGPAMYDSHLPSDFWAASARPPHPSP